VKKKKKKKKKKQPKTVKAWAFEVGGETVRLCDEELAHAACAVFERRGISVGPIVSIEVPAPKEAKP